MYKLIEFVFWGKRSRLYRILHSWWREEHRRRSLTIDGHDWRHLKDDIYGNLPQREAAKALKIIYYYERYMSAQ